MQAVGLQYPCYVVEGTAAAANAMKESESKALRTAAAESMIKDGFKVCEGARVCVLSA